MAGRKPKPTALKVLEGEKNKDRINLNEPQALPEFLSPPSDLPEHALAMWKDLAPKLGRLGITTELDYYAFEALCRVYALWRDEPEKMNRLQRLQSALGEFGLTPATRSRLTGYTNQQTSDPMERLLAGGM